MFDKNGRERLGRLANEMQSIINKCKSEGNRGLKAHERSKFDALMDDYNSLENLIQRAERSDAINSRLAGCSPSNIAEFGAVELQDSFRLSPGEKRLRDKDPQARAFSKYLRHGIDALDGNERAAMAFIPLDNAGPQIRNAQTLTTTGGGYLVPQGFSQQLEEAKKWFGGIPGVVGKFETESGNPLPWPTVNDTTNKGRILGVNTQLTETDLTFGQVVFSAYIGTSDLVLVPLALIQDSYFDLDGLVARLLGTRLGRLYNNKCTVGSGSNEPTGIVTASVAAGSTYTMAAASPANGVTGITSFAYADLVEIEHKVDPAYRFENNSRWMFHDSTLKVLKKMVDGQGRPLWQPGLTASFRDGAAVDLLDARPTILGHPYIINNDMAAPAANANAILFGDMSTFKVREVSGGTTVMRLVERYADYLQVGFLAFQRFDSNLIDAGSHPLAVGVCAAA